MAFHNTKVLYLLFDKRHVPLSIYTGRTLRITLGSRYRFKSTFSWLEACLSVDAGISADIGQTPAYIFNEAYWPHITPG